MHKYIKLISGIMEITILRKINENFPNVTNHNTVIILIDIVICLLINKNKLISLNRI